MDCASNLGRGVIHVPGSARASRAGDDGLVIANFSNIGLWIEVRFGEAPETSTRGRVRFPEIRSCAIESGDTRDKE